jgi:hypothetical protein
MEQCQSSWQVAKNIKGLSYKDRWNTHSWASMVKDTYVWYGVMIESSWIICTLVQVENWRKYVLEENNKWFIFIFHLVHNKFNTVL